MAFQAEHILYDGISSERFGLKLYNDNGGLETTSGSSFSILRAPLHGGLEYIYLGRENKDPIPIELHFASEKPLDAIMQGVIHQWLVGKNGYRELRIMQPDMNTYRIGCIFHEIEYLQNGNMTIGVLVRGECDSCYFRGNDIENNAVGSSGSFLIMNLSDVNDYIYPTIEITMPSDGGSISIINKNDNNREFLIEDLAGSEIIEVDNLHKIITSSNSIKRLSNFNYKWLRFVRGKNEISFSCTGGSVAIKMKTPVYRLVGQ